MGWLKIDDGFLDHRKVVELGKDARLLWLAGALECARQFTDGELSSAVVRRLLRRDELDDRAIEELVVVGLWHDEGHTCETCPEVLEGYVVHDYLDYNPTADEVKARRDREREKKRRQRARGSEAVENGAAGRFRPRSPSLSPGDTPEDTRGESPATRPVPSRPPSSSSPPPSNDADGDREEEDSTELLTAACRVLAERVFARRTGEPVTNPAAWLAHVTAERVELHGARSAELLADVEHDASSLADLLEPELAPARATPQPDPACPECFGELWIDVDDGAGVLPCPRCKVGEPSPSNVVELEPFDREATRAAGREGAPRARAALGGRR